MAANPAYDLLVLLDPEVPEERRTELLEQVKRQIDTGGATLKGDADWGMRRLAFEIDHRREAQYHLFQFEATPDVLRQLDRSLSIDDSVLRHRIIRLPGEAPEVTPRPPEEAPRRAGEDRGSREGGRGRDREGTETDGDVAEEAPSAGETPEETPAEAAPEPTVEPAADTPQEAPEAPAGEQPAGEPA